MEVRADVHLDASPERVFEVLMDPACLEHWVTAHRKIAKAPEGPLEKGSTFKQKLRVAGVAFSVIWEVTKLDAPRLAEWEGEGPAGSRARAVYKLEPDGDGTLFHYTNEWQLPGGKIAAAAGKAIGEDLARSEAEKSLENLESFLGSSGSRTDSQEG